MVQDRNSRNTIFVADFFNHRIQKFSDTGEYLVSIGSEGMSGGQFNLPTDVVVDDEGYVYVVDFGNNRIQKFEKISIENIP